MILLMGFVFGLVGISSFIISNPPFESTISTKIINYSNSQYAEAIGIFDNTNIKNFLISLAAIFMWDRMKTKDEFFCVMSLFFVIGTAWRLAFSDFGILAARVATLFTIVEVILIPNMIHAFDKRISLKIIIVTYGLLTIAMNISIKDIVNPY
ncbi:EpsG family protein [Endozoicomonas gorgoniicola]|uniref:EpsG family protein n=1 Tax=Endozoicomonas gorgoniicola TaxID=1234144 RepID=A0ABT3MUZ4_9GAMM|nr:EpsG family protein [Endozoicomonas gorgoniicola]MCW7553207.1 EpsG family protein [Endozoicomonas gorgoniicola]